MTLRIVSGTANRSLATAVTDALHTEQTSCDIVRFPDGELRPVVGRMRGDDVYVVQPTGPPVNEHLTELLLLLDACRRAGARRITAVVPYFGYARQDRRSRPGEAVGARVAADVLAAAGAQRLVVVDPHTVALEAMCAMPVEMLTAVPALADALTTASPAQAVVVAPDLGAVKLAERYAATLRAPVVVVRKTRLSGTEVHAEELVGDIEDRQTIIVDDMISTGATIAAAVRVLLAHGARPGIVVAATHGLLVGDASGCLQSLPLSRLVTTDTVPPPDLPVLPIELVSVAPLLADAIHRLHDNKPLDDLLFGP